MGAEANEGARAGVWTGGGSGWAEVQAARTAARILKVHGGVNGQDCPVGGVWEASDGESLRTVEGGGMHSRRQLEVSSRVR